MRCLLPSVQLQLRARPTPAQNPQNRLSKQDPHAHSSAMSHIPLSLVSLPDELLQLILEPLPTPDLKQVALVSNRLYRHASEFLWKNVCLTDTWRLHASEETDLYCERGQGESDEHDDTPTIQKLFILATNPAIANKVQVLTHRCHLPTPNIFTELSRIYFDAEYLSRDLRLHDLLRLAIRNMGNVNTLRIIYGHKHMTRALLEGFLDPDRPRRIPLRRLWLENCSLIGIRIDFPSMVQLSGLESIRIRRLRAESTYAEELMIMKFFEFRNSRGGQSFALQDGAGGWVWSTVEFGKQNHPAGRSQSMSEYLQLKAEHFDAMIWEELPEIQEFIEENRLEPRPSGNLPPMPILHILEASSSSLTNLSLDWILWRRRGSDQDHPAFISSIQALAQIKFPNLRSLQVRNAVVAQTALPDDVYLLEYTFLNFLEAHPKLQCLAWPLDRFYSHKRPSQAILSRSRQLVAHLGVVLTDLRVDTYYDVAGEQLTDESTECEETLRRVRRRRFIQEFAPFMRRIEKIKLEGGIPRDEKREILRALHLCPLKKLVIIGVSFPVGNSWGQRGRDLHKVDQGHPTDVVYNLEEEDLETIVKSYMHKVQPTPSDGDYEPCYGWPSGAPFLSTLAADFASTIEELKICGYNGSPILSSPHCAVKYPPEITSALLAPLMNFHNLRQLVVSFWLLTWFEDSYRDSEIVKSWMDTRSPASTALVVVTPPVSPTSEHAVAATIMHTDSMAPRPPPYNRWAVALKTQFTPSALAYRVAADMGPHLSPEAKARRGGVRVRASFCLGSRGGRRHANDIFDLDIRIGRENQVLEFTGPREEGEPGRWWSKLEARRWF
ncbi:hypothetical protein K504DRAFT_467562 [Pleomassaria siparia CBS 279.74]|uniref:F-box domain-containing protein n=1 Tax=Pleomassaria siparia CBS 279.74 TaxID=1314801 RepID=A0A6G1KAV0_9PLEO|nr:hypothetical protein K504DRAFT_467562 [Pleomassaria siparia CBS 279.74]